jgi:hypothetical protein
MPANFTTLAHFSVLSAISLAKSAREPGSARRPRSSWDGSPLVTARQAARGELSLSGVSQDVAARARNERYKHFRDR